ncbi:class I SAM-dependent methyltransferase [Dolichospermum sp. UHCC 0684]|uniref:class I SAM-dependent methyltransferase n=1 Tax=unclassified Dolichospermum TaxID=2622029 RepID=UPI001447C1C8|nr:MULTISPECIES: class I SAM-dependent methyltransferase [unclassified Dolichospermum]MBO1052102.1 class I SAM-dependent methyltransferase [Dolichospermum sp. DET73]MEA5529271.1 class I SAM-dependent methyltransferase [Dolichospermum sp. UHCC 0684]MTJ15423.1 class I SAM-dependent methyltransferase [Dolichospermum sp. UHCC 0299]MTJ20545.1 class I SAM-dependent methyltransferase [Dolichospermum sp. UHCC 0352]MTJ35995.1 class I SAM-dependent methyltransferase [Dolichospermum sp. UHCC 0260]
MATIFRDLSYRYQWLYDGISRLAAVTVGGEPRFRQLALQNLKLQSDTQILDLCCGSGQVTRFLVNFSENVTGLDASPLSIQRAQKNVPNATYIKAFAENMPFADNLFDVVHTSAALHEMQSEQLQKIIKEVYRVLKPGGVFTLVDFHSPTNPIFWPGLAVFFWLFETQTAWELLKTDLPGLLRDYGFDVGKPTLYAGGSLQVIQGRKMI